METCDQNMSSEYLSNFPTKLLRSPCLLQKALEWGHLNSLFVVIIVVYEFELFVACPASTNYF